MMTTKTAHHTAPINTMPAVLRVIVIVLAVYFAARQVAQVGVHAGWIDLGLPQDVAVTWVGGDLFINISAAGRLTAGEDLYYSGVPPKFEVYNYTPFYAFFLSRLRFLTFPQHAALHAVLTLAAYAGLFFTWRWMFPRLGLPQAVPLLYLALPAWLVYTAYWGDALLLNLYVILALATSWLFYCLWRERLWPAAIILVLVLQVKPQWAFALALPLLLGRFRFLARLTVLVAAGYLLLIAVTIALLGPDYGLSQYAAYYEMLRTHHLEIPWHGPGEFLGYDHSIAQVYFYLFGYRPEAWPIVRAIKLAVLAPLGIFTALRLLKMVKPSSAQIHPPSEEGGYALECFFALYCAAFVWLDLVWEATLSIVIFTYLVAVSGRKARWLAALPFGLYVISDLWQITGIALASVVVDEATLTTLGPPLWADPSFHLPLILFVFLTFYGLLVSRLLRRILIFSSHPVPVHPRI
jgi:hypothetical protein